MNELWAKMQQGVQELENEDEIKLEQHKVRIKIYYVK